MAAEPEDQGEPGGNVPPGGRRTAIVTGGNSGIGLAIARTLARTGMHVVIAARSEARNREAIALIGLTDNIVSAIACDVRDERAVDDLVARTIDSQGRLDVCVASAGGIPGGTAPLEDMDSGMWRDALALNPDGVFFLYRAAARAMIKTGRGGSLIGISSISAIRATASVHYAAAKGGLNAMTICLASQLGPRGIRVNAIMPGMIETPATAHVLENDEQRERIVKRIPLGRVGKGPDIADLACFLASDRSAYMTGQVLTVDGGMSG